MSAQHSCNNNDADWCCRRRCQRKCDVTMSDVIHANKTHPDFRYSRPESWTRRVDDDHDEEQKENRPSRTDIDDDVVRHRFRFAAVDRNRKWSAMKRTSTARSSLQSCTARLFTNVSDIRREPEIDEAGTLISDDSFSCDVDDLCSVTENQLRATHSQNGK